MARKKKKGKVINMLSPVQYIKQKARSLPIFECYINTTWEEDQLADIIVARQHTNKNITLGIYLVDLKCLGVKDSQYFFNITPAEYRNLIDKMHESIGIEKQRYNLVHNIIYAGLEYAEELGFMPHEDFSIAKYLLEEDNDAIEIIDIECGVNGKPFYIKGPLDSNLRSKQIIDHLYQTVGKGNFDFIDEDQNGLDFEDDDNFTFEDDSLDEELLKEMNAIVNSMSNKEKEEFEASYNEIQESAVFVFRIQLKDIKRPPVWRTVAVPSYIDFLDFHIIIQIAFGWLNKHLFSFSPKGFGSYPQIVKDEEDGENNLFNTTLIANEIKLSEIFKEKDQKFTYIYDWGDEWTHQIKLIDIVDDILFFPEIIDGKGACPFEDCGGPHQYERIKTILSNPNDKEFKPMKEWYLGDGDEFNPLDFNIAQQQAMLNMIFSPEDDDDDDTFLLK